ncbi:SMI1/KNR4 family protein [Pseudomonas sp. NPDC089406]|uniref:SMI1/KNR4 family protein n=1 Tax=Pseudomonas sp. NPDC089406 TaxID=3364463 RepID=UPI00384FAA98
MIPNNLKKTLEHHENIHLRKDKDLASKALENLDVSPETEFGQILLSYIIADVISNVSDETLSEISEPSESVLWATEFIHRTWKLPYNYICFTSLEGEGGYIMEKSSGKIWDFDLSERENFLKGEIPAHWNGFYEFLEWYLS